jgi:NTP pyrophosphatase (non-canonical NTP hydrolase)
MDFSEYQKLSKRTAIYPQIGHNVAYPTLGLAGETGEVADKVKKIFRDQGGEITDENREDISGELGDVLWYLAQIASELNLDLSAVAQKNLDKLMSRLERNKLSGSGDKR